jgi:hypothetical protein
VSVTLLEHDKKYDLCNSHITFAHTNVNNEDAVFVDRRLELFIAISYTRVRLILVYRVDQRPIRVICARVVHVQYSVACVNTYSRFPILQNTSNNH